MAEFQSKFFGIDYGCSDNDAIFGVAWSDDEDKGYQFFECKFNRLDIGDYKISQLEYLKMQVKKAWLQALEFFGPFHSIEEAKQANKRILWDADDNDQHVTQELGLNVNFKEDDYEFLEQLTMQIANAHKTDKADLFVKHIYYILYIILGHNIVVFSLIKRDLKEKQLKMGNPQEDTRNETNPCIDSPTYFPSN